MISLLPPEHIVIRPATAAGGDDVACSEVRVGIRVAPQSVAGVVLEAALSCDGRILLFLSDDIPHEDSLRIHWLDEELKLLDSASLGWMYSTGTFRLLQLVQPRSVRFRFFGATDWTVTVFDSAALRVPFLSEPRGVHRRFGFTRHFRIDGDPQPEQPGG